MRPAMQALEINKRNKERNIDIVTNTKKSKKSKKSSKNSYSINSSHNSYSIRRNPEKSENEHVRK